METTREFLAAVKQRHGLTSDYQLAKFLGLSKQRISANQAGAVMADEAAVKVADALDLDRAHVLAIIAAERATDEAVKKAWRRAAAATAAILGALALVQFAPINSGELWLSISALPAALQFDLTNHYTELGALVALALAALLVWRAARKESGQGKNNANSRSVA